MYKDITSRFWNHPNTVSDFEQRKPSKFLVDFFSRIKTDNKKILDLGCGGGRNTKMLVSLGFDVYACDNSVGMVEAARKRIKKQAAKNVIVASMTSLPYPDSFFYFVVSSGVFHNAFSLKELGKAIKESARVLIKGGMLLVNIFSSDIVDSKLKALKEDSVYITPQGLPMVLISDKELIGLMKKNRLFLVKPLMKKEVLVETGKRMAVKGIFQKSL